MTHTDGGIAQAILPDVRFPYVDIANAPDAQASDDIYRVWQFVRAFDSNGARIMRVVRLPDGPRGRTDRPFRARTGWRTIGAGSRQRTKHFSNS